MPASSVSSAAAKSQRMSFVQQRLWFVEQLQSSVGIANPAVAVRIIGALEPERLAVHLGQTIARQDIFRTRFVLNANDAPEAQILPQSPFLLRQEDLAQQRKQLERRLQQEQQTHFDLTHPPLLRGLLLRLAETEHVLMLCAHPIVLDLPALVRFTNEWMLAFAHSVDGAPAPTMAPPAASYGDYAQWQQQEWQSGAWNTALHEVCDTLRQVPEVLNLPWDHPRPAMQTHTSQHLGLSVPPALLQGLAAVCERHALRLDAVVFGLYALLLGRLSSQTDLCIGVPVDTRASAALESLPGHFENLLPVRVPLAFDKSVLQILQDVQAHLDFMLARKALPYEKVLETLALPRSMQYSPLLQVAFSTQALALQSPVCNSLRFERYPLAPETSPYDLQLHAQLGDKPVFTWQFNTALLERRTVEHWHQYFLTLIQSATQGLDSKAGKIALLDDAQQQALLMHLTGDTAQIAHKQSLYGRVVLLSRQVPRHTAIIQGEQFVRYQSLVQQAEMWAAALRSLGVTPGERVVMAMPRSAEAVVALLAVWRAGGCAVPVPHECSEERARAVLLQIQPVLTLFHAGTPVSESMQRWRGAAQGVSEFSTLAGLPAVTNLREEAFPRMDAAALMFMTTEPTLADKSFSGDPRQAPAFVQVTHGALLNLFQSLALRLQLRANVQWLAMADFHSDISVLETMMPLLSGAGLVIANNAELEDIDAWVGLIKQRNITCMVAAPAQFRELVARTPLPQGCTLFCRNEVLNPEDANEFLKAGAAVVNLTGTPETTLVSALHLVLECKGLDNKHLDGKSHESKAGEIDCDVAVGKPILNTRLRIVDEQGMQVLPGGSGELLVGGGAVSPGYWQRDDLNNVRFVQAAGDRYFRTGFRARLDSEGQVHLLERAVQRHDDVSGHPPAASLEMAVLHCWQQLLGRNDIGFEQAFSDLGGTSLAALRLAAHVNRYFGASLPLAVLLQAPTVRAQAWCLQNAGVPLSALSLQTPQTGDAGRVPWVFLFDEAGSIALWQAQLSAIPASVPVHVVQCHRYSESSSLKVLAQACLALLPDGPVALAGAGFGGALAAAMAAEAPKRVCRLAMIDTPVSWQAPLESPPAEVDSEEVTVADEHAAQLAHYHQQLWKQAPEFLLTMPVQCVTASCGITSSGGARGWAMYATTLDLMPLDGDRADALKQWCAMTDFVISDVAAPTPLALEAGEPA